MDQDVNYLVTKREVSHLATWNVSSAKLGCGSDRLRDGKLETFWQSEGGIPHTIDIRWSKRMALKQLSIYCDFEMDESYTPSGMVLRAGSNDEDLEEIHQVELQIPRGWVHFDLEREGDEEEVDEDRDDVTAVPATRTPLLAHMLQIVILSNHQNGKDSHIRGIKVFAPRDESPAITAGDLAPTPLTSWQFKMHETVR